MDNIKTIDDGYKYFYKRVHYYIELFGLKDYDVYVSHQETLDNGNSLGSCLSNNQNRNTTIWISDKFIQDLIDKKMLPGSTLSIKDEINNTARHEVLELLLTDLREIGQKLFNFEYVDKQVHITIRRIENALSQFEGLKK